MKSSGLFLFTLLFLVIAGFSSLTDPVADREILYVGTADMNESEGLYVLEINRVSGELRHLQTVRDRTGPNFQALHPEGTVLYSVSGQAYSEEIDQGTVSSYRIDPGSGLLDLINEQPAGDRGPAHVSVDPNGEFVYVSNYGPGTLTMLRLEEDGTLGELTDHVQHEGRGAHETRQQGPQMHSAVPSEDGRFLYASDLGIDRIHIYRVDREQGRLRPAGTPYVETEPGAGPRHFTIHPSGEYAYSVEELSFTVTVYRRDTESGALEQMQREVLVPDGTDTSGYISAADIHTSPDGLFLYVSTRGADIITVYRIDRNSGRINVVEYVSTEGEHPRNFAVDRKGEYLFVANRDDDHVTVFRRDEDSGSLEFTGTEIEVPAAGAGRAVFPMRP